MNATLTTTLLVIIYAVGISALVISILAFTEDKSPTLEFSSPHRNYYVRVATGVNIIDESPLLVDKVKLYNGDHILILADSVSGIYKFVQQGLPLVLITKSIGIGSFIIPKEGTYKDVEFVMTSILERQKNSIVPVPYSSREIWVEQLKEELNTSALFNDEPTFIGANENTAGKKGLVPAPKENVNSMWLASNGTWKTIETKNITESSMNLFYTTDRFNTDIAKLTTDNLSEGTSNKYFTTVAFNQQLQLKSTDDLLEGVQNKYFSDSRVDSRINTVMRSTSNLQEGTNLYFTSGRVDAMFRQKSTNDISEGTNLYYTDNRFDTRLNTKTTSDITEGKNLYFTNSRVDNYLQLYQQPILNYEDTSSFATTSDTYISISSTSSITGKYLIFFSGEFRGSLSTSSGICSMFQDGTNNPSCERQFQGQIPTSISFQNVVDLNNQSITIQMKSIVGQKTIIVTNRCLTLLKIG